MEDEIRKDLDLIRKPEDWPAWPALPVVRRDRAMIYSQEAYTGFLFAGQRFVYLANLFYLRRHHMDKTWNFLPWGELTKDVPVIIYPSLLAIAEKWRVE